MGLRIISKSIAILSILLLYSNNIEAQVYLRTQQDVDNFSGWVYLPSSLYILGDSTQPVNERITDLTPLQNLILIEGSLFINNTYLTNLNGLENVNLHLSFSADLTIRNNKFLTDVSAIAGIQCNFARFMENPSLNITQLNAINAIQVGLFNLPLVTNFSRNKNALCSKFVLNDCGNLELIDLKFNNDTSFSISVSDNPLLKKLIVAFDGTQPVPPTNNIEFLALNSIVYISNNDVLENIEVENKYAPYIKFNVLNNPMLDDLCFLEKSIKSHYNYAKAFSDSMFGPHYWDLIKGSFISGNKYPFDTYDNALAADCSQYTTIKEQSLTDEDVSNFSIYPNPYTGGALQLNGVKTGNQIVLYDIVGKEVYRTQYTGSAISLPQVNKGLYLIEAKNLKGHREYVKLYID